MQQNLILSLTRGQLDELEQQLLQVYGCLLDEETCLPDCFMPLEQTRVHWKEQNAEWWQLFTLATDVEDWLRTRQGPKLGR